MKNIKTKKGLLAIAGVIALAFVLGAFVFHSPFNCYGNDTYVTAADEGWSEYRNCQFGYSIEFPPSVTAQSAGATSEGALEEVVFSQADDESFAFTVRVFKNAAELDMNMWLGSFKFKFPAIAVVEASDGRLAMKGAQQLTLTDGDKTETVVAFQKGELVYFLQFPADTQSPNFITYSEMVHTFVRN